MAINNAYGGPLTGLPALLASQTLADTPRGGTEFGFRGISGSGNTAVQTQPKPGANPEQNDTEQPDSADQQNFAGLGSWLEDVDAEVFKTADQLVERQEPLARNRLEQDKHWTRIKYGYWSRLEKDQDRDTWRCSAPPGMMGQRPLSAPNKALDLVNKAAETLMVDPPLPDPAPLDDSDEAAKAAQMAGIILDEDAGESGSNDLAVMGAAVELSLSRASGFLHQWVDKTGGGYTPLQIKAHPLATDVNNPLVDPQTGMPTDTYELRYVAAGPDGQQVFTDNAAEAAPSWLPKHRVDVLKREHVRLYPETADIWGAEKVILLWFCTVGEAKRRWQVVADMNESQIEQLVSWQPRRYLVLLPPALRARFRTSSGSAKKNGGGTGDERLVFFYVVYQIATPEHPKGAGVYVSGANDGTVLEKDTLAFTTPMPGKQGNSELKCQDIPVTQVRLRQDVDDGDSTGISFLSMFGGANDARQQLITGWLEAMDIILHVEKYTPATSPVSADDIEESRATGKAISIATAADKPTYGAVPVLPPGFLETIQYLDTQEDSMASLPKPVQGANDQQEVSGVARRIAVQQGLVGLSRMNQSFLQSNERYWRIKCQLFQRYYDVPQQLRYSGADGQYKQHQWTGVDFALVGSVDTQKGTGTMLGPDAKVQFVANAVKAQLFGADEAAFAVRGTIADALGIDESTHDQLIERCITAFEDGPPDGWQPPVAAVPPIMMPGPPMQVPGPNGVPTVQPGQPQPQPWNGQPGAPGAPPQPSNFNPFAPRPNDDEPEVAVLWKRRLSQVISSAKYDTLCKKYPQWCDQLVEKYHGARQTVAMAANPQMAMQGAPGGQAPPAPGAPPGAPTPQPQAALPPHPPGGMTPDGQASPTTTAPQHGAP